MRGTGATTGEEPATRRIGLVAPLPPQVGGVTSVAEWLLDHEVDIGCRYATFDLYRPAGGEVGGSLTLAAAYRQLRLLLAYGHWLLRAPRLVHVMVSLTRTGLLRDTAFIVLARLAGRRVVAHVHGSDLEQIRRRSLRGAALRLVGRMSSECVAIAPSLAGRLGELGVRASAILNPVRVHPDRDAPRAEEAGGAFRLLFVGTYGARKGCPELVRALALAREQGADVSLTFAGKEERHGEEAHLRGLVDELQLDGAVSFAGVVAAKDLPILYRAASAFCLPSYREGLPMALLEAMAAGLPSITCAVGGIGDVVVDGDSGLLVPSGDVDRLAAAIVVLASDEDRRRQMGESARDRVYRVAGDAHVAMQWHELYARLHLPERDAAVYP